MRQLVARPVQHRMGSDHQNASQILVASFRDRPELLFAASRILPRYDPDPGRKVTTRSKNLRVRDGGGDGGRTHNANPRDAPEPLAYFVRAMLSNDPPLNRSNHRLQRLKPRRQHDEAGMSINRQACILFGRNDLQQLLDPFAPLSSHNAELRHMRPQSIDQLGPLPHQKVARAMQHQLTLLLDRFDLNKKHGRPPDLLADMLLIG